MAVPGILFAAPSSGTGKTLITCGILQALKDRGLSIASYKCGPDYIDPMFHERVIGTKSRNIDTFFTDENTTAYLYEKQAAGMDLCVVEGVMGYYDGLGGIRTAGSSYDVACTLDLPAVLIVPAKGTSLSVAALIKGFLDYRKDSHIKGVILNRISKPMYQMLKPVLEEELGIRVLGYIPEVKNLILESRHLGLVLPGEVEDLKSRLREFARTLSETVDLDGILELAGEAGQLSYRSPEIPKLFSEDDAPVIAVAKDEAFCFTYLDNLQLLEEMGARLVYFSPLHDKDLPSGISGLILSGGYPELHAEALSNNISMLTQIHDAVLSGLPTIAECGGFLYLHKTLEDMDHKMRPVAGVIDAEAFRTDKLGRFGYIELTLNKDQLIGEKGMAIRGHEFHYWDSTAPGEDIHAAKPTGKRTWECVHASDNLYAGFPHLFYYSNLKMPERFLKKCGEYRK